MRITFSLAWGLFVLSCEWALFAVEDMASKLAVSLQTVQLKINFSTTSCCWRLVLHSSQYFIRSAYRATVRQGAEENPFSAEWKLRMPSRIATMSPNDHVIAACSLTFAATTWISLRPSVRSSLTREQSNLTACISAQNSVTLCEQWSAMEVDDCDSEVLHGILGNARSLDSPDSIFSQTCISLLVFWNLNSAGGAWSCDALCKCCTHSWRRVNSAAASSNSSPRLPLPLSIIETTNPNWCWENRASARDSSSCTPTFMLCLDATLARNPSWFSSRATASLCRADVSKKLSRPLSVIFQRALALMSPTRSCLLRGWPKVYEYTRCHWQSCALLQAELPE